MVGRCVTAAPGGVLAYPLHTAGDRHGFPLWDPQGLLSAFWEAGLLPARTRGSPGGTGLSGGSLLMAPGVTFL